MPDGTSVKFITTSGTLTPEVDVTFGGAVNTVYKVDPDAVGRVRSIKITAASGSSFGTAKIRIDCVIATPTQPSTTGVQVSGGGALSGAQGATPKPTCIPIGDNICVPQANAITPPNTGDAGLLPGEPRRQVGSN